jgi:hypothetical protein
MGSTKPLLPQDVTVLNPLNIPKNSSSSVKSSNAKSLDAQPEHSRMTLTIILGDHVKIKPLGSKEKKLGESVKSVQPYYATPFIRFVNHIFTKKFKTKFQNKISISGAFGLWLTQGRFKDYKSEFAYPMGSTKPLLPHDQVNH